MLSAASQAILRDVASVVLSRDRYVDIGVEIRVVKRVHGELVEVGRHPFGGIVDAAAKPPRIIAESEAPLEWDCSEDQWSIIEHGDSEAVGKLVLGGMGAGKSCGGVLWTYLRWLEVLGQGLEIGVVAPTAKRLSLVTNEIFKRFPAKWRRYQKSTGLITMCDGTRLRCVSTHKVSAASGSPLQGFNWAGGVFVDEIQDCTAAITDIQARLRSDRGRAKRLGTCTSKDSPDWRDSKDTLLGSGVWTLHTMIGPRSPFVASEHWESLRKQTTERDYRRLVMAEDVPSESRVYHCWSRDQNYIPIPLGARKLTSTVVAKKIGGHGWGVLLGNDPGQSKTATVWLDAYHVPQRVAEMIGAPVGEPIWFVRDELLTHGSTTEEHATQAMRITRETFACNLRDDFEQAHVRTQPLGMSENRPGFDVLAIWRRVGFDIRSAQYSKTGTPMGQIRPADRIEMINRLLCAADGKRRLFIEHGRCKQLVAALETMERDLRGRAEHETKDARHDKSDLPCALAHALHPWCKESAIALRDDIRRGLQP